MLDPATLRAIAADMDRTERHARRLVGCGRPWCIPCRHWLARADLAVELAGQLRTAAIRHQASLPAAAPATPPASDPPPEPDPPAPARPTRLGRILQHTLGYAVALCLAAGAVTAVALAILGAATIIEWAIHAQ